MTWLLLQPSRAKTGCLFCCHFRSIYKLTDSYMTCVENSLKQIRNLGTQQNWHLMKCGWNSPTGRNKMVWFRVTELQVMQWQSVRPRGLLDLSSLAVSGCCRCLLKTLFGWSPVVWASAANVCLTLVFSCSSFCCFEMKVCPEAQYCKLKSKYNEVFWPWNWVSLGV